METKKTALIRILNIMKRDRALADGFITIIQDKNTNETIIDELLTITQESIKNVKSKQNKNNLAKTINLLENLHKKEAQEKVKDEQEIDKILKEIE